MSEWQDKNDFEINKAVALSVGLNVDDEQYLSLHDRCDRTVLCRDGFDISVGVDYCNNPSDSWPIILDTCMTIELAHPELGQIGTNTIYNPFGTDWQCDYTENKDCLRAAMIVYLEMNGVKPNE